MAKLPFIPFYPNDWLRDTRRLSGPTKAAWIDILAIAWNEPERGIYHRTQESMFRELGISKENWNTFIALELADVAEIDEPGNGLVTIISRRMVKEEKHRELNRNRVSRFRELRECNAPSNASVMVDISEVRSQKSEVRSKKVNRKSVCFQKPSLDEVKGFATSEGLPMDASHFIDYYESNGWKVGKNPMKDWKATVRNWARNNFGKENKNGTNGSTGVSRFTAIAERAREVRRAEGLRKVNDPTGGTLLDRLGIKPLDQTALPSSVNPKPVEPRVGSNGHPVP